MQKKSRKLFLAALLKIIFISIAALTFIPKFRYGRYLGLQYRLKLLLKKQKLEKAKVLANELINTAKNYKDDWNYGNAIHQGHLTLGKIAFAHGDFKKAEEELLASVEINGSPSISSFGPNMSLARDFLIKERPDIVLKYLKNCRRCWKYGSENLDYWSHQIRNGQTPDFGGNLNY
jgi:hypothetical protein